MFPVGTIELGVLFRLVSLKIDGTGLGGASSIYQGHLFFQKVVGTFW